MTTTLPEGLVLPRRPSLIARLRREGFPMTAALILVGVAVLAIFRRKTGLPHDGRAARARP